MQAQFMDFKVFRKDAQESRTNTAYGKLGTPDQVTVILPPDGKLLVGYWALWQNSAASAARAAIFLGANQLMSPNNSPGNTVQEVTGNSTAAVDMPLYSSGRGLETVTSATAFPVPATTGMVLGYAGTAFPGDLCPILADPGSYVVSVQFKSSSGSVSVKNRHLWVGVLEPTGRD